MELVYSVRVAGQPIPALTAADDMRLVSMAEVESELGYRVLTKAEPYLKSHLPLNGGVQLARGRDTWLLVGAAVSAVCLLLLLAALVTLALGKRKRQPVATNRQRVFEKEQEAGVANLGYEEEGAGVKSKSSSQRAPSFQQATVSFQDDAHRTSSASSASSSQASLVRRRPTLGHTTRRGSRRGTHAGRRRAKDGPEGEDIAEKPQPKPRRRQLLRESSKQQDDLENGQQRDTHDDASNDEEPSAGAITRVGPAVSPNSLLSMPSVKSFPRGANIPEPLARVLEPVPVGHLDSEDLVVLPQRAGARPVKLSRHGSVEGEDPGVVGPLVWDLHCHHLLYQQNKHLGRTEKDFELDDVEDMDDVDARRSPDVAASNVGRMRRRFNELLDDAFSLFGSRSVSPDASSSPPLNGSSMHRVHSAIVRPVGEPFNFDLTPRPRTSGCRPATAAPTVARPRGAWATKEPSIGSAFSGTLARPLSAGPFHRPQLTLSGEPIIERDLVMEDSHLAPSDPAVPLIAAIKEELRKFQDPRPAPTLPGAATPK